MDNNTKIDWRKACRSATKHWAFRISVPVGVLAVLGIVGMSAMSGISAQVAQADPQPVCVQCPAGYHCVHNPEGCEKD